MVIRWPFDNVCYEQPRSPDAIAEALDRLRKAGIAAAHRSDRYELLDCITGQPSGYVQCAEVFDVDPSDAARARTILEQTLDAPDRQGA